VNILQINTLDSKGGAAKVAYRLKSDLASRGHKNTLFVSKKYSQDEDVKLIRPYSNLRQRINKKLSYYLANDLDLFPSNHILGLPEFKSADIIHCHNLHTNYFNLSTLQKISAIKPVVWTLHDMWPITAHCAHSFDGKIKKSGFFTCPSLDIYPPIAWHNERYLESKKAKIYQKSHFHIVTPSKWLANKVSQSVLKDRPLTVIYNGIDTEIFKRSDLKSSRSDLNLPQDKKIILIVAKGGKSNPWKGGNYAEEIVKRLSDKPDILFVNLGGNNNKSDNLINAGYISDEQILARYYSASDVLLYPSIADNCPLVVLEAQACGLPVISFDTGGIPELINHGVDGYIAKYKDAEDLLEGVKLFLSFDNNKIEFIRSNLAKKIEDGLTIKKMTDQYLDLYNSLQEPFGQNISS